MNNANGAAAAAENPMGTEPVRKIMLKMGLPMILSMAVQAFYNIVDSYFVSRIPDSEGIEHLGEYAVNALSLSFPIQMLIIAVGVGTGVGINSILSRSLGSGEKEKAAKIAGNAVFLGICTYAVFLLFGIFGVRTFLRTQTSDEIILDLGVNYLSICCILSIGAVGGMIYEKLLQSTGKTVLSTIAQVAGAVVNIVLDPILIYGWLGLPRLGASGAAYATVAGQLVTMFMGMFFHYKKNREIDGNVKYMKPDLHIIGSIYRVGAPAIVMQALMSVMTYGINIIFGMVSAAAVTAYGLYYKVQQFVFFAAFGMNNAIIPITAFNYGKMDKKRIQSCVTWGLVYTLILMFIGMVFLQIFAEPISGIFALSDETGALCVKALRVITLGYLFAGANIAFQGIFQALGHGVKSLAVSVFRQLIIVLPLAYILSRAENAMQMIWWSVPAAEVIGFAAAVIFYIIVRRSIIDKISSD